VPWKIPATPPQHRRAPDSVPSPHGHHAWTM
jgi:hypothetical protein